MGLICKLVLSAGLLYGGYHIGHNLVPPEQRFEPVQKQGIEIVIEKETKKEYV